MSLTTTVIGSLPRLHEDLKKSIKLAIDLQVSIGISIISDGEQRTDMLSYMSNSMHGINKVNEKVFITGKIRPIEEITNSFKVADFLEAKSYIKERGYENKLKVGITGPITFGFSAAINKLGPYKNLRDKELYKDVATVVNKIAKQIQHYDGLVQIDEPGVSAGFLDPNLSEEPLNIATEDLDPKLTSIHVCGKLNPNILKTLGKIKNLSILSLEFAGSSDNVDMLSKSLLSISSKKVGVGCMKVNVLSQEDLTPIEKSVEIVRNISSIVGSNKIAYIHPDCGLRKTSIELATVILKNLKEVSGKVKL
ncbi:MAG: hypothetical protein HA495_04855 [Thaumarchaeota archaeon]|jgi:5-methyltetrahydropteroyltriglutamate--homocysteine methyltransferase|nr:hypothetical protein [Nitrososphaerota archaeon]